MEVVYTNDVFYAECALGYPLVQGVQQPGETVGLNEPQRFTLLSVISGLEKAVLADRASAAAVSEEFDRAHWVPSDDALAEISTEHRIHRHYLRGIAGLKQQLAEMEAGEWDDGEPFYPHQLEGMRLLIADMESNDPLAQSSQGAFFNISGGGGKSRMIAMAIAGYTKFDTPDDPSRVLFVAHDNVGLSEVVGADGESGLGKYAPGLDVGVVNKDSKQFGSGVVGTTIAMLRRRAPGSAQASDEDIADEVSDEPVTADESFIAPFSIVFSDESHRLLGKQTTESVRSLGRRVYGFTGSDRYSRDRTVSGLLPKELLAVSTRELIMQDRLAPLQFWICKTGQVIHRESGRADYSQQELDRIAQMPERHQIAGDIGLAFFKNGQNGVFSCNNIAEANALAESMSGDVTMPDGSIRPVRVVAVHSKNGKNNDEVFKALQNDDIQAVTIVDIDTAWNVPRATFMVHLRPRTTVSARQVNARLYRRFYDEQGRVITGQIVDLCDIVDTKKSQGSNPELSIQLFAPMLFGYDRYDAGMVLASPQSEGKRRDFDIGQFPPHIRRALTIADGVSFRKLAVFGAGIVREAVSAPDGYITLHDAQRGLGVTAARLRTAILSQGVRSRGGQLIDENGLNKVAQHLIALDEPVI